MINDADAIVMDTRKFLSRDIVSYLDNRKVHEIIDGEEHWVIGFAPECAYYATKFLALHQERVGIAAEMIAVPLPISYGITLIMFFPKAHLTIEEIIDIANLPGDNIDELQTHQYIVIHTILSEKLVHSVDTFNIYYEA